jgi:hypothetical protein
MQARLPQQKLALFAIGAVLAVLGGVIAAWMLLFPTTEWGVTPRDLTPFARVMLTLVAVQGGIIAGGFLLYQSARK